MKITTSDEQTLEEAMSATLEERTLGQVGIDDRFSSLDDQKTWVLSNDSLPTPLPTHLILKVKRDADGSV